MENGIVMHGICKQYSTGQNRVSALYDINLTIRRGEFVAVTGQSGSGKSTLLHLLGCLDAPSSGSYHLDGTDMLHLRDRQLSELRNRQIGFIFQHFHLLPHLSALENVELPLTYRGMSASHRRKLATDSLARVGLANRMHHLPSELSGGQQQRVAIARAIASKPPLLLADEPTGNLDTASGREVLSLLCRLHREGNTIVLITHDPHVAAAAERCLCIRDGRLISPELP